MQYNVYPGNVTGTPLQLARDIMAGSVKDYIFFRGDEYTYYLVYGDIDYTDLIYDGKLISITYTRDSNQFNTWYYSVSAPVDSSGSISNAAGAAVYGSHPGLPHLVDSQGDVYASATLAAVAILSLYLIIRDFFRKLT